MRSLDHILCELQSLDSLSGGIVYRKPLEGLSERSGGHRLIGPEQTEHRCVLLFRFPSGWRAVRTRRVGSLSVRLV